MRAILVVYPGCTHSEVAPLLALLDGVATLTTVGPSAAPVRVKEGFAIAVDRSFAGEDASDAALVVVPGGDLTAVAEDAALAALLGRAGGVLAAICNGVLLVGASGRAKGRRVTHTAVEAWAPRPTFDALLALAGRVLVGSHYVDEDVVVDERLVTAKPWAAIDFAKQVVQVAGLCGRDEAASRARYLRGIRDASIGDPYQRWAIRLEAIEGVRATRADIEAHVAHLRALERTGRLELAGPFEEGGGLVVVRARSRGEAESIAGADPFVSRGLRRMELRRWQLSCDDDDHLLG